MMKNWYFRQVIISVVALGFFFLIFSLLNCWALEGRDRFITVVVAVFLAAFAAFVAALVADFIVMGANNIVVANIAFAAYTLFVVTIFAISVAVVVAIIAGVVAVAFALSVIILVLAALAAYTNDMALTADITLIGVSERDILIFSLLRAMCVFLLVISFSL